MKGGGKKKKKDPPILLATYWNFVIKIWRSRGGKKKEISKSSKFEPLFFSWKILLVGREIIFFRSKCLENNPKFFGISSY
jgi:hypothetical protein